MDVGDIAGGGPDGEASHIGDGTRRLVDDHEAVEIIDGRGRVVRRAIQHTGNGVESEVIHVVERRGERVGGDGDVVHSGSEGVIDVQARRRVDLEEAVEQRVARGGVLTAMDGKNRPRLPIEVHAANIGHGDAAERAVEGITGAHAASQGGHHAGGRSSGELHGIDFLIVGLGGANDDLIDEIRCLREGVGEVTGSHRGVRGDGHDMYGAAGLHELDAGDKGCLVSLAHTHGRRIHRCGEAELEIFRRAGVCSR